MNDSPVHFTLRKTQAHFAARQTWLGLAIVGVVLGLVGPFGTFDIIAVVPRLLYWLAICTVSYAAGFASTSILMAYFGDRLRPLWLRTVIAGLLPGIPIALLVFAINGLSFGFGPGGVIDLATLLIYCPLIALCVTIASMLSIPKPAAALVAVQPALLDRLPHSLRGRLLHLAVEDHYVAVTTDKGRFLVLMRLSDAIREAAPVPGLQVHRSHWIALDAVQKAARLSGKPVLHLQTGTIIPVSRTFLDAARQAGLIV